MSALRNLVVGFSALGLLAGCGADDGGDGASSDDAGATSQDDAGRSQGDAGASQGDAGTPVDYSTWPASADEALGRSVYWNEILQVPHEGTVRTATDGEVIENLHIQNGELIVEHSNVKVRNVTIEGLGCVENGNYPIEITAGVTGVVIDGASLGPTKHCWNTTCNMPTFPSTSVIARGGAEFTIRGCAIRNVGDAFKFLPTSTSTTTALIQDCHTEIARGIWRASDNCDGDHTDSIQVQSIGEVDLTIHRTSMDALPFIADSENTPLYQLSSPAGSTGLQLTDNTTGRLRYDTVRLNSGNFSLRINNAAIELNIVDSAAIGATYGPLQAAGNVTFGEWSGNTLDDGAPWEP